MYAPPLGQKECKAANPLPLPPPPISVPNGSLGYTNFTTSPSIRIDGDHQYTSVVFKIDENKQ
jgi:hypothetical protein